MIQEIRKPIQDLLVCHGYQDYSMATGNWIKKKRKRVYNTMGFGVCIVGDRKYKHHPDF